MATQQEEQQGKAPEQGSTQKSEEGIERKTGASPQVRRGQYGQGPFSLMRQFTEDIDRLFGGFFGPGLYRLGGWPGRLEPGAQSELGFWPEVEVNRTGNKLVVQADLPGLKKDDVTIEVRDNELIIAGERRSESERTEGGYYQSERSYGSFRRTLPLPKGVKTEAASATFENGVLKIEMELPSEEEARGRRIEVREGSAH